MSVGLPSWHPAFLLEKAYYDQVQKGWVTIEGQHKYYADAGEGSGSKNVKGLVAEDVALKTKESGGSTTSLGGRMPKGGYIVSPYEKLEVTVDKADFEKNPTQHIMDFVNKNEKQLSGIDHYLGTWYNAKDGKVYLDVVIHQSSVSNAVRTAIGHNQLAIYDVKSGQDIKSEDYGKYTKKSFPEGQTDDPQSQADVGHGNGGAGDGDDPSRGQKSYRHPEVIKSLVKLQSILQRFQKGWITTKEGNHVLIDDSKAGNAGSRGSSGGGSQSTVSNVTPSSGGNINGLTKSEVHDAILKSAQANPHVQDPEALATQLTDQYVKASSEKAAIDSISSKVAGQIDGATILQGDLKGFRSDGSFNPDRAVEKFRQDGQVKDLARNTILVKSVDDAETARGLLAQNGVVVDAGKDYFAHPTYLGYVGMNGNHAGEGITGEVQVHVPEVLYYKQASYESQSALGQTLFNQIKANADRAGLVAGQGHQIYEQIREVENTAIQQGRYSINSTGRKDIIFRPTELQRMAPLVDQSNRGYATALRLAATR